MCQGKVRPISQLFPLMWNAKPALYGQKMLSHWHLHQSYMVKMKSNQQRDCQRCINLLTTFSSGTDRLNVHSWLLTKESKKKKVKKKLRHAALRGNPSVCILFDPSYLQYSIPLDDGNVTLQLQFIDYCSLCNKFYDWLLSCNIDMAKHIYS